jgi:glycerophosphoryl diester phosphodiesterase
MTAARTSIEELMVKTLHSKGYATSAPYGSTAWRARPVLIQSFESTSLRRFAALTPVPLALLLDKNAAPDTGAPLSETLFEANLAQLSSFVTVVAPWKAMFYTISEQQEAAGNGLALPGTPAAGGVVASTGSSQQLMHAAAGRGVQVSAEAGSLHPDVPLTSSAARELQDSQHLQSTGLAALLHKHGFLVHTYTLRDEGQFVLPTCKQEISCEFEWLFGHEGLDGAFADWPDTLVQWVRQQQQQQQRQHHLP